MAYGNVIGVEIENSINADIYQNHTYNNSTGLFIDLLPQLDSKVSLQTRVYDNLNEDNNLANFARAGEVGQLVPEVTGLLILGGDEVEVYNNTFRNNRTVGVTVFSTAIGFDPTELDIGPNPERVYLHNNIYENNGFNLAPALTDLGIPGADVIWDVSDWDNRFDEQGIKTFPPILPSSGWPDLLRKTYWQTLNFAINRLI